MSHNLWQPELKHLLSLVRGPSYKVVSFDIFDTLLRRSISSPKHLFWLMGAELEKRGHPESWCKRFGEARVIAGERALHHVSLIGREDATFAEIYELLGVMLPPAAPHLDEIMQLELDLEDTFLEANPLGQILYREALQAGKRVILTSDQYLPRDFLENVLRKAGVDSFERFFLSGELGALKVSGTLYEWMPLALGVQKSDIVHIGDNHHVDVGVPRAHGVAAFPLPTSVDLADHPGRYSAATRATTMGSIAAARYMNRRADQVVAGRILSRRDDADFIGHAVYGPILFALATWLVDHLRKNAVDRIWLLARDGEGLAKVIALVYPEFSDRFEYVYASRRLIVYSSGAVTGNEVFRHYRHLLLEGCTVHAFIDAISGGTVDFSPLKQDFSAEDTVSDRTTLRDLERALDRFCRRLQAGDIVSPDRARVVEYYRSCLRGARRIGIFDVGWRGNLQRGLDVLLKDDDVQLTGFYVGHVYETEIHKPHIRTSSFAFDCNFPPEVFSDIEPNIWPLETIFGGTTLSAVDIRKTPEGWVPVYEKPTPSKAALCGLAARFQDGAIRFIEDALSWNKDVLFTLGAPRFGLELMREFLARPDYYDATTLENINWTINIDEKDGAPLIRRAGKSARSIIEARDASVWKAGFYAVTSPRRLKQMHRYTKRTERFQRRAARIARWFGR